MRSRSLVLIVLAACADPSGGGSDDTGTSTSSGAASGSSSGSESSSAAATDAIDGSGESTSGAADTTAGSSETGPPPEDDGIMSVLTVNLRTPLTSPNDVEARTQIVADLILELVPDFVALQEVTEGNGLDNRAQVLAELTGYEWRWSQTHDLIYAEGVGVLSRWPILWDEAVVLPHPDLFGTVDRKVIGIGIDAPWGEVAAFSTHMTLNEDQSVRADQAVAAYAFVDERRTAVPGVLAGDTNATPETLAMMVLRGEAEHDGVSGDLVDAWLAVHPDDPGYTFSSDAPRRRIDYVYVVAGTEIAGEVIACERRLMRAVDGVLASDHLAVACRIRIRS